MKDIVAQLAMKAADGIYACLPRRTPSQDALSACKVVSHRGEHDNRDVFENTLAAFRVAKSHGVWGLEADIRWTADLVPVINHDADGSRLFGDKGVRAELSLQELRTRMPLIPTLAELIAEFGGDMHLMLEIKDENYPQADRQKQILEAALSELEAGTDYHFLALDTDLFERVDFVARKYCLPVAELNTHRLSKVALEQGLAGLSGHFLLLTPVLQKRHEHCGQCIGTGFISSRNCLYRELERGVEWIFSNNAVKIQGLRDRALWT